MIRGDPSRSELIRPGLVVRVDPVRLLYLPEHTYILLTKKEGNIGRILAPGFDSTDPVQPGLVRKKKTRANTCILPVRFQASLITESRITELYN